MYSNVIIALRNLFSYLLETIAHNWFVLLFGVVVAVAITVYVDTEKVRKLFLRRPRFLILGSVAFGALTPFCACGTMAVMLSFISSAFPWGAIMAFLVSSPLMSPDMFVMLAGFLGLNFALALAVSSIILGFGAGWLCNYLETHTHFLDNQLKQNGALNRNVCCDAPLINLMIKSAEVRSVRSQLVGEVRFVGRRNSSTACCIEADIQGNSCFNNGLEVRSPLNERLLSLVTKLRVRDFVVSFIDLGIKKVLPLFILFVAVAYVVKEYVPTEWIVTLFSGNHFYSIPLAAILGLPMYVSDASVVPLLQVLRDAGASEGALLAYMISGPATSLGVIGGLSLNLKRRVVVLYLLIILIGAITLGFGYDMVTSLVL